MNLADQSRPDEGMAAMAAELAREDRVREAIGAVLPHLVGGEDAMALGEEPVVRTRATLLSLADDLLRRGGGTGNAATLHQALANSAALLAHCHGLALETATSERLAAAGLDPVLSPWLEELLGGETGRAALAMRTISAQARFVARQRRMGADVAELPAELMHAALLALADLPGGPGDQGAAALRAAYDEGRTRLSLLAQVVLAGSEFGERVLDPSAAGFALFATALAARSGAPRQEVLLASSTGQEFRLLLLMRAAGASAEATGSALALIHPEGRLPGDWLDISHEAAGALLAGAAA
ncbi:MAG TPA: hypothetical protein VFP14_06140 [Novosphingobium sp.]|nr:hypothetical protein [Novosphingobium sp.]